MLSLMCFSLATHWVGVEQDDAVPLGPRRCFFFVDVVKEG